MFEGCGDGHRPWGVVERRGYVRPVACAREWLRRRRGRRRLPARGREAARDGVSGAGGAPSQRAHAPVHTCNWRVSSASVTWTNPHLVAAELESRTGCSVVLLRKGIVGWGLEVAER